LCADREVILLGQSQLLFNLIGCPILAVLARVRIFSPPIPAFPINHQSKSPPFETHNGWGTRTAFVRTPPNHFSESAKATAWLESPNPVSE
jgi:hypothetical protein